MASLNRAQIIGHLGKDPEVRYTASGTAVASFSMATSEKWKDKAGEEQERTDWHNIVLWGKLAEIAGEYLKKGALCMIEGKLQTRKWDDKDGITRYTTEINGQTMLMLGQKSGTRPPHPADSEGDTTPVYEQPVYDDTEDIPF